MKTTLDLPDDLLQRLKIRAVQERRSLKRLVADLLNRALETPPAPQPSPSFSLPEGIELNERGFPVIRCGPNASAAQMTPAELVALEKQILEEEDLQRAGFPL
ncbi:MAG: hypothetical protein RMN51_10760 [Verrucomicrobiota bacterium]|nr:hypothetical protein [Verrucomicrobiota bacterium]